MRRCLKNFCESTSMHGAARIGNSKSHFLLRIFWFLLVLVAAGWSGYNVMQIVINFMKRPVSTVLSVEFEENLPFPAVTVCNLNPVRYSKYYEAHPDTTPGGNTSRQNNGSYNNNMTGADSSNFSSYNYYDYFADYSDYTEEADLRSYMDQLPHDDRMKLGHQLNKMLIHCSYQTRPCTQKDFKQLSNLEYGNCFTFNKDSNATSVSKSGPTYGLSLLLNLETEEYLEFTETVGFKVVVHPADAMPFPEDEGIVVSPGFATSVGIRRLDISRTPAPYGRCNDYTVERNRKVNMYAEEFDVGYTDKVCLPKNVFSTSDDRRMRLLRCGLPLYRPQQHFFPDYYYYDEHPYENKTSPKASSTTEDKPRATYCNLTESDHKYCVDSVRERFQLGKLHCKDECAPSCKETLYETEVSMGVWPSKYALEKLSNQFEKMPKEYFGGGEFEQDFIRENVVRIEIFFKQLNYEHLRTVPAYDWYRLLSDLGGQLGLWLGFSLLTAMEILSLLVDLARHGVLKLLHRDRGSKVVSQASGVFTTPVQNIKF